MRLSESVNAHYRLSQQSYSSVLLKVAIANAGLVVMDAIFAIKQHHKLRERKMLDDDETQNRRFS